MTTSSETVAPIIVTALFGDADFAWLDGLRRAHFPPERNIVPAHLTLFHHLAPSLEAELTGRLRNETRDISPPIARVSGLIRLGGGVAFRVDSEELQAIRARLADAFATMLVPQDAAGWRPHVTIQNKAAPAEAAVLHAAMLAQFRLRPLEIAGLAAWRYMGGPWAPIGRHLFNRSGRSRCN